MKKVSLLLLSGAMLALTGCATSYKPDVYQSGQLQQQMKIKLATVLEIREVEIATPPSGAGASAGAAGGAVAAGANGRGGIISGIAGAVIGGVVGTVAEKAVNAKKGIEITYQIDNNPDMMALVQEQDEKDPIVKGDRIRIMEGSFASRAVKIPKS